MRTLQVALRFRRTAAIGLAIFLILVTLTGLMTALPSKAAKRPNTPGPRPVATRAIVYRPLSGLTDWPMSGSNPAHIGANAGEALLSPVTAPGLTLTGRTDVGVICGCNWSWSPAVVGGIVYLEASEPGNYKGWVLALDEMTNRPLWTFSVDGDIFGTPTVVNGVVYVTTYPESLYALNATTGKPLWSYTDASINWKASPTVVNGVVYTSNVAIDATTGKLLWHYVDAGGDSFRDTATVANGVVYLVSAHGCLYALNASTGALVWKYTDNIGGGTPVVANGIVYYGGNSIYAVDATTGKLVWHVSHAGVVGAVTPGMVYVGGDQLYAFNAATGAEIWSLDPGSDGGVNVGIGSIGVAVANGVLFASTGRTNNGYPGDTLYAIDASTGIKLWQYTGYDVYGGFAAFDPVVANGRVIAMDSNTILYTFQPAIRPLAATH